MSDERDPGDEHHDEPVYETTTREAVAEYERENPQGRPPVRLQIVGAAALRDIDSTWRRTGRR